MGFTAPHDAEMHHPIATQIVEIAAVPHEQAAVFLAAGRGTDEVGHAKSVAQGGAC
jgi:hypothetical protein